MKFLILVFTTLASGFAFAQSLPEERICRNFNVRAIVVDAPQAFVTKMVLCDFGGGSLIEAKTLDQSSLGQYWRTWAVESYKHNIYPSQKTCSFYNAWVVTGRDKNGTTYDLCEFGDQSYMEFNTFRWGWKSNNTSMDFALGLY